MNMTLIETVICGLFDPYIDLQDVLRIRNLIFTLFFQLSAGHG